MYKCNITLFASACIHIQIRVQWLNHNNLSSCFFLFFSPKFLCTSHQAMLKGKPRKTFDVTLSTKSMFFKFRVWGSGGATAWQPPPLWYGPGFSPRWTSAFWIPSSRNVTKTLIHICSIYPPVQQTDMY